jgi:hypothetical protein
MSDLGILYIAATLLYSGCFTCDVQKYPRIAET